MITQKKKKIKCTLVQVLRLCTGSTVHRGSGGIALLFLDHGTRRGEGGSVTPQLLFTGTEALYRPYGPWGSRAIARLFLDQGTRRGVRGNMLRTSWISICFFQGQNILLNLYFLLFCLSTDILSIQRLQPNSHCF